MATILALILSAVLFIWELKGIGSDYGAGSARQDAYAAALLYVRSIFILVCAPFLWISQLFKLLGWLPTNDLESPSLLQMKLFAWTINAVLTCVFLWKVFERVTRG